MRIQLFLGAALVTVLSGAATGQEVPAREPDVVAVPRLIPPRYELLESQQLNCISAREKAARVVGGAAAGYVLMPGLAIPVLMFASPFLIRDGGSPGMDSATNVVQAVGAIAGAIGGLKSIERAKARRCPRRLVNSPLASQR